MNRLVSKILAIHLALAVSIAGFTATTHVHVHPHNDNNDSHVVSCCQSHSSHHHSHESPSESDNSPASPSSDDCFLCKLLVNFSAEIDIASILESDLLTERLSVETYDSFFLDAQRIIFARGPPAVV